MYIDYWKVRNIPTNHEVNLNFPYLACFVFCEPRNRKSKRFGEFCVCWLPHVEGERQGWRVRFRPVPTPRRFWSRKSHHPPFKPCMREEDRFSLRLVPIKRNFHDNGQAQGDRTESKDAAFEAARRSTTIPCAAGKQSYCLPILIGRYDFGKDFVQRRPIRIEKTGWPFSCCTRSCSRALGQLQKLHLSAMFDRLPLGRWHGNFETRTIKVVPSSWDKEAIMPSMRMAVCFDGRIFIHDHIPNNTLRAPLPLPMFQIPYVLFLGLFTVRQSMHLYILFVIHFFTA